MTDTHAKKVEGMKRRLAESTCRSVTAWLDALDAQTFGTDAEARAWLRDRGVGHFQARLILSEHKAR